MNSSKRVFLFLLWISMGLSAFAQHYIPKNDIPVRVNGQDLRAAWTGGLNNPQFNAIDLNGDGTKDLVIFDRYDDTVLPFLNNGTANQVDYDFAPEYISAFPTGMASWTLFKDFDGDGHEDIFTAVPSTSNIRVYRNVTGTFGTLSFQIFKDTLISTYPPTLFLYSAETDIPGIIDVDDDGDLDILTFHVGGGVIEWHKNLSMENHGNANFLEFEVASRCFGHFEEDASTCIAFVNMTPCGPGERLNQAALDLMLSGSGAHTGSTILALDLNNDSKKDLILGDVGCNEVYALYNGGSLQVAHFDSVSYDFPNYNVPIDVLTFPATFYLDVDNDDQMDLVSAPNQLTDIEDANGTWWHKNTGTTNAPVFDFQGHGILQNEMIETGTASAPAFFDHNNDGLMDLLIGNLGRYDSMGSHITSMKLYENIGTSMLPAFELVDDDYLGLATNSTFQALDYAVPTLGDLDGDGDVDMLFGEITGNLYYFENVAPQGNDADFSFVTSSYQGINVGLYSAPNLYDLDGDLDLDLLIGNHQGLIAYYENTGTTSAPSFTMVTDSFGHININDFTGQPFSNGFAKPLVLDYDGDSQLELLVGTIEGPIEVYEDFSLAAGATFTRVNDLFGLDLGGYTSIVATVLDSAKLSYVVGGFRGGLWLLRDGGPLSSQPTATVADAELLIYPNPVRDILNIRLDNVRSRSGFRMAVFNAFGQQIAERDMPSGTATLDTRGYAKGMYFLVVEGRDGKVTKRFVVQD